MNYSGVTSINGRTVNVMFNPGWGEPGEWYVNFFDGTKAHIDNVEGMGDQQEYLSMLSEDKYRDKIIETNWSTVGSKDDIVRVVVEFVEYNEDNKQQDLSILEQAGKVIRDYADSITKGIGTPEFSVRDFRIKSNRFSQILKEVEETIEICQDRIRVYESLKDRKPVGMGWSNESFLHDFPNSPYIPRIKQLMQ